MSEEAGSAAPVPRRLHPATLVTRTLQIAPQMLAGGAGYAAVVAREGFGKVLVFAGIAAAIGAVVALLVWLRFRYTVGAREIVIEQGLLQRQRRVIPFDRVQDIAIEQKLLARLFGTAKVKIETGGAAKDEGNLDMIALADAHALRDHIRRWHAGAAPAEAESRAAGAEPVLFAMNLGRLLLSGLFNFSLIFLAAIFAAMQYLDDFGLFDPMDWLAGANADQARGLVTIRLALGLAGLLLLLGMVAGVARTVAKDFGYRLTRAEAGLRRKRGLFTLSEVVIPIRRTQVAVIDSGPIARRLGWYRLSFQTLGADQKEGGVQVAAPFARMEEILPILAEAGFPAPPPRHEFAGVPRRALVRQAAPWLALAAVGTAVALAFEPRAGIAAAVLLVLGIFALLRWRKHAHALGDRALFVSGGLFRRRLWIVPFEKAQTISVFRSPLQRRLRLATLLVDTAGASSLRTPEMADLDAGEADAMAERLLALFYRTRAGIRAAR